MQNWKYHKLPSEKKYSKIFCYLFAGSTGSDCWFWTRGGWVGKHSQACQATVPPVWSFWVCCSSSWGPCTVFSGGFLLKISDQSLRIYISFNQSFLKIHFLDAFKIYRKVKIRLSTLMPMSSMRKGGGMTYEVVVVDFWCATIMTSPRY